MSEDGSYGRELLHRRWMRSKAVAGLQTVVLLTAEEVDMAAK
jgi:hypothetical protein